jgi:hypothetical protein
MENQANEILTRQEDQKSFKGIIKFIEFNSKGNKLYTDIKKGRSCVVNPQAGFLYTWLTTEITEVISNKEFKTKNSHYKIE